MILAALRIKGQRPQTPAGFSVRLNLILDFDFQGNAFFFFFALRHWACFLFYLCKSLQAKVWKKFLPLLLVLSLFVWAERWEKLSLCDVTKGGDTRSGDLPSQPGIPLCSLCSSWVPDTLDTACHMTRHVRWQITKHKSENEMVYHENISQQVE